MATSTDNQFSTSSDAGLAPSQKSDAECEFTISPNAPGSFSIGEARKIVQDLFQPNPVIYWADFLLCLTFGSAAFVGTRHLWAPTPWRAALSAVLFLTAAILYYRVALFTHELVHFKKESFRNFRFAWNVLFGIPFLMPSFLYHSHVMHHMRRHYGTQEDGEYVAFALLPPKHILGYLSQSFIIPLLAIVRFLILSPLAWVSPRIRRFVARKCSAMIIDPTFVRPLPTREEVGIWRIQEVGCFVVLVGLIVCVATGLTSWTVPISMYATAVTIITVNAIRTLVAHRYLSPGTEMTHSEQLVDSLNFPYWPLTSVLWAPVGLRFHALHHLFPSMPYHNLAKAHARLAAQLPPDNLYHKTVSRGLAAAIAELWRTSKGAAAKA